MSEPKPIWVINKSCTGVEEVSATEHKNYAKYYQTRTEALAALRDFLVKEITYNGRDMKRMLKKIDEMRAKQADDAVTLYNVRLALGEVYGD